MISSSMNVGKYRVEENITPLGIAWMVCKLTVSLLIPPPKVGVASYSVPSGFSRLPGWGLSCAMHCTDMSLPTFINIFNPYFLLSPHGSG